MEAVKPVYVTHSFNKARKKSFDLKPRNEENNMPGPGNYEPNPDFIKPRASEISMTMAGASKRITRNKKELSDTPGPGSYKVSVKKVDKAHLFPTAAKNVTRQ